MLKKNTSRYSNNDRCNKGFIKCLFYGMMMLVCSSCREPAKNQAGVSVVKPNMEYLTYGLLPAADRQDAEAIVAWRWGFSFKSVAGCLVTVKLTDSVAAHNHQIDLILEKKHGKQWFIPFKKEVDTEMQVDQKVIELLSQVKRNIIKAKALKKGGIVLAYTLTATANPHIYEASAQALKKIKNEYRRVTFYKYLVDIENNSVKITSDTLSIN